MEQSALEAKINQIEKDVSDLKNKPNQAVIDKTMEIVLDKLNDRDKIIELELKNLSQSISLQISKELRDSIDELNISFNSKLKEGFNTYKEKVSWGMEVVRFIVVLVMFVLSIKLIK